MSLINEALRKARQAASEHDSKPPDGPFQPSRAYPSRRSKHGSGLLATVMLAVAAGVIGAGAAWWLLSDREPASTAISIVDEPSTEAASPSAMPAEFPTPVEDRTTVEPLEAPPQPEPVLAEVEQIVSDPAPQVSDAEDSVTESGDNRVFIMEAEVDGVSLNLGYIVARSNNPFAEINGIDVWIGSEIEGFIVEAIEANRVILRDDKGPLVLRVP